MPRRVKVAILLAFILHGVLILTARYRLSYDAYNHMFFADHYLRNWWSLWEPRWYTGFKVVSYPPLVHQLIALFGHIMGVDAAFALILWIVLTTYPLAIYQFARIFVGRVAASYAAIGAALLPSMFLTAHVFGQLPTLFATLIALFGTVVLADFLHNGSALTGALAIFLFATVMAAHHATLLFLPWLIGAVVLNTFLDRRINRYFILLRLGVFVILTTIAGWLVIFPFWQWGSHQTLQTTIDHASRHNFFQDPFAAVLFFLPMYGLFIPFIPFALWIGRRKRLWGISIAFLFLFLLGLGDTTPLPRLFFGPGWAWLTYDRFSFWASLLLMVFFGAMMVMLRSTRMFRRGEQRARKEKDNFSVFSRHSLANTFVVVMVSIALMIGLIPSWLPTQPPKLDMQPILDFLAQDGHSNWRYLTFGFGDQLAFLSRLTDATTIDGSYHTARLLPELRASGIGQIDTAYWIPNGLKALDPILQDSGEHGVRWGFVNSKFFIPVLWRNGWRLITTLSNGVMVWENPQATLPQLVKPPAEKPFTAFAWGTFPLFAMIMSGGLALRRYRPDLSESILPGMQVFAVGLLPIGLTFWSYRTLFAFPHERIYFTYSDALFFLSDGIALFAVLAWAINKIPLAPIPRLSLRYASGISPSKQKRDFGEGIWLFALCILASLSIFWSLDWRTSLYVSLQTWLAFGLYLSLREMPSAWHSFAIGAVAALVLQVVIGTWQVVTQSTASTMTLGLDWPGNLLPSQSGASVVQLADGTRWLRAYGTLPHPNLLGGWTLVLLASLLTLILLPSKGRVPLLILFNAGLVLLVLTFSRSAWLGLIVISAILLFRRRWLDLKSLRPVAITGLTCCTLLLIPFRQMFFTRLVDNQVQTEQVSTFTRSWLVERTWELIRQRPILGVGAGGYSLALSQHVAEFYDIEPVHNLPLLAWSELGIGGIFALAGLTVTIGKRSFQARHPLTIIFSALLAGLFAISFFDHYLWTLAPGRLMFASVLGLWSGQVRDERGG